MTTMKTYVGIDLGSTTTKAVVIDERQQVIGRGITNSRSNYDTAAAVAKQEALLNGRFHLFREALGVEARIDLGFHFRTSCQLGRRAVPRMRPV